MAKIAKFSALVMLGSMAVGASACAGSHKYDLHLWHNFGANYSGFIKESFVDPLLTNDGIDLFADSKNSYDGIKEKITYSIAPKTYPNIATGYPDHFASYARSGYPKSATGILLNLNTYLDNPTLNAEHKAKYGYDLREDYYPEYMVENNSICYDLEDPDKFLTVGLPFNKSTEVLGYNGLFMDYVVQEETKAGREIHVPTTWAEWETYGKIFRKYQMDLNGNYLVGTLSEDGDEKGSNLSISKTPTSNVLLDFSQCKDDETAVLSWDSLANMFITLVRQFDSQFTSYTKEDRTQSKIADRHGYMEFFSDTVYEGAKDKSKTNKQKTIEAMEMVRRLYGTPVDVDADAATQKAQLATRVFATPSFFGGAYASNAFADNKVLFTVCSTGGLSYNINPGQRFRVAPIPYNDADLKFVISQGANMTVFDRGNIDKKDEYTWDQTCALAFKTVVKMTTGDYQATWAMKTGYYPASKSATESKIYQDFLASTEAIKDPIQRAYREGAQLNNDHYMNSSLKWTKFVDPGFDGSAKIRTKADSIVSTVVAKIGEATVAEILQDVYNDADVRTYVRG